MNRLVTRNDMTKSLAELIGTSVFVFMGVGAVGAAKSIGDPGQAANLLIVGLGHGLGIMIGVLVFGRISGAHMNPAVTVASVLAGRTSVVRGVMYIVAQLAGAVLAVAALNGLAFDYDNLGLHQVSPALSVGEGILLEILLTFFLVFTVFSLAFDKRGASALAPLGIGMVITLGHFVAIGLTGASMNPARSFGPALVFGEFNQHWVYWVGPITGGAVAAVAYVCIFGDSEARSRMGRIKVSGDVD